MFSNRLTSRFEQNLLTCVYLSDIYGKSLAIRRTLKVKNEKKFGVIGKNILESKLVRGSKFDDLLGGQASVITINKAFGCDPVA